MLHFISRNILRCERQSPDNCLSVTQDDLFVLARRSSSNGTSIHFLQNPCEQFPWFFSIQIWALWSYVFSMLGVACFSKEMGFLCATLINFSVGIFVDKMEKQSCRMPTILEGNIAIDSQGMRNYLGFFSNFRPGKFRIPDLFKFGRSNKLGSK